MAYKLQIDQTNVVFCNGCQMEPDKCNEHPKHGIDCAKIFHSAEFDYAHHGRYEGSYLLNDIEYCGRCHMEIK